MLELHKKAYKEAGISKTSAAEAADDVCLSSAAAEAQEAMGSSEAPQTPQERFLASAAGELSKLDPNSEEFFGEAASSLVRSALREAFGERIESSRGYPQMHDKLVRTICKDERYREVVEDFLGSWVQLQEAGHQAGNAEPDAEENGSYGDTEM